MSEKTDDLFEQIQSLARFPDENPNPVLRVAFDGRITYANAPSADLLKHWGISVGDPLPSEPLGELRSAIEEAHNTEYEAELDGRCILLSITPIFDAEYANFYGRDITSQRAAEQRVRSIARFPDENPHPVLRFDPDGTISYRNLAANTLLDEWSVQLAEVAPVDVAAAVRRSFNTGQPVEIEVTCGSDTFALVLAPIRDAGYVNCYAHNITRRNQALLEARDQALAASRAKSAFLANMSHELRTPMNAIIGYSEMLVEDAEDLGVGELIPDLQKIRSAGKHLLDLINNVLDLSKIEAGKMTLFLEDFDVRKVTNDVADTIRTVIEKNGNRFDLELAGDLPEMHADQVKVRQSLFNLLSNAAKFTKQGTITLRVSSIGDRVRFDVRDTGIGMSEDQLAHVFESFSQADASTTKKYGGTGLGLTITKQFCEMMGGTLTVSSELEKGTTFSMELPTQVSTTDSIPPVSASTVSGKAHDAATILVIDDDLAVCEIVADALKKGGFTVATARGGADGLALARKLKPKVITLDVIMPGMDGWQVLAELKKDPELSEVPVVLVSILDDRNMGFALGAADYLTKPIDRNRILEVIRRHVSSDGTGTILVVDDEETARDLTKRALASAGYEIVEAEHGRAALELLESGQLPKLIVLDLMMPVMDGFEFLARLRGDERWRDLPVVVATAKELTKAEQNQLMGSAERVFKKGSYSKEDLLDEVKSRVEASVRAAIGAGGTK